MGNSIIKETENYKHLGFNINKYLNQNISIKESCDKLKGTFFSIMHSGVFYEGTLHPITCNKIYRSVVLPKALYGSENWANLFDSEILTLERAHKFCVKHMQSFNIRIRTDVALSLLGIYPIENEIDFKKLIHVDLILVFG